MTSLQSDSTGTVDVVYRPTRGTRRQHIWASAARSPENPLEAKEDISYACALKTPGAYNIESIQPCSKWLPFRSPCCTIITCLASLTDACSRPSSNNIPLLTFTGYGSADIWHKQLYRSALDSGSKYPRDMGPQYRPAWLRWDCACTALFTSTSFTASADGGCDGGLESNGC